MNTETDMLCEKWKCIVCAGENAPCRVEIVYQNSKLPQHLHNRERFINRVCLCEDRARVPTPNWQRE